MTEIDPVPLSGETADRVLGVIAAIPVGIFRVEDVQSHPDAHGLTDRQIETVLDRLSTYGYVERDDMDGVSCWVQRSDIPVGRQFGTLVSMVSDRGVLDDMSWSGVTGLTKGFHPSITYQLMRHNRTEFAADDNDTRSSAVLNAGGAPRPQITRQMTDHNQPTDSIGVDRLRNEEVGV